MIKQSIFMLFVAVALMQPTPQKNKDSKIEEQIKSFIPELQGATERGRLLYEYDLAAWHGTDAVLALKPQQENVKGYIGQKIEGRWTFAFGKFNESKDRFLITYQAVQGGKSTEFTASKLDTPKEDNAYYFFAMCARQLAYADFNSSAHNRQYNIAVLPAPAGQWYVYILPAQTINGVFPLGGDFRYLISADGKTIVEIHKMHQSILEIDTRNTPPHTEAGYHTHILSDLPEDSDVFHVLTRTPSYPELVSTPKYMFRIETDGTMPISVIKDLSKKKK